MSRRRRCRLFSFASTAATESVFGGAAVLLDPHASRYNRSGFDRPTYITPCRLVSAESEDMQRMMGRIIDELPQIRLQLHRALGIKTGTCAGSGSASGSLRGQLVQLAGAFVAEAGIEFGVIMSEPEYSMQERYQIIIPILDAEEYEEDEMDVVVEGHDWLSRTNGIERALLPVPYIQSVFHPTEIRREVGAVIDEATMRELDTYLLQLFGL